MSTKRLVLLAILATSLVGCTSVERMSDEDLAAGIQVAAKGAAQYGLGYVLNRGALVALFRGLAAGLEAGAALAPVLEAPPAKLFWPKA
jgi:hypothetical protein